MFPSILDSFHLVDSEQQDDDDAEKQQQHANNVTTLFLLEEPPPPPSQESSSSSSSHHRQNWKMNSNSMKTTTTTTTENTDTNETTIYDSWTTRDEQILLLPREEKEPFIETTAEIRSTSLEENVIAQASLHVSSVVMDNLPEVIVVTSSSDQNHEERHHHHLQRQQQQQELDGVHHHHDKKGQHPDNLAKVAVDHSQASLPKETTEACIDKGELLQQLDRLAQLQRQYLIEPTKRVVEKDHEEVAPHEEQEESHRVVHTFLSLLRLGLHRQAVNTCLDADVQTSHPGLPYLASAVAWLRYARHCKRDLVDDETWQWGPLEAGAHVGQVVRLGEQRGRRGRRGEGQRPQQALQVFEVAATDDASVSNDDDNDSNEASSPRYTSPNKNCKNHHPNPRIVAMYWRKVPRRWMPQSWRVSRVAVVVVAPPPRRVTALRNLMDVDNSRYDVDEYDNLQPEVRLHNRRPNKQRHSYRGCKTCVTEGY